MSRGKTQKSICYPNSSPAAFTQRVPPVLSITLLYHVADLSAQPYLQSPVELQHVPLLLCWPRWLCPTEADALVNQHCEDHLSAKVTVKQYHYLKAC